MSLYAIKTENIGVIHKWVEQTVDRGKENNMLKNPYEWKITKVRKKNDLIVVIDAKPLYPNFSWLGWMGGVMVLFVWGASKWLIPCCIVGCLGIFWTADFMVLMTKKALRKAGYTGPIKRMKHSEIIKEAIL